MVDDDRPWSARRSATIPATRSRVGAMGCGAVDEVTVRTTGRTMRPPAPSRPRPSPFPSSVGHRLALHLKLKSLAFAPVCSLLSSKLCELCYLDERFQGPTPVQLPGKGADPAAPPTAALDGVLVSLIDSLANPAAPKCMPSKFVSGITKKLPTSTRRLLVAPRFAGLRATFAAPYGHCSRSLPTFALVRPPVVRSFLTAITEPTGNMAPPVLALSDKKVLEKVRR